MQRSKAAAKEAACRPPFGRSRSFIHNSCSPGNKNSANFPTVGRQARTLQSI